MPGVSGIELYEEIARRRPVSGERVSEVALPS